MTGKNIPALGEGAIKFVKKHARVTVIVLVILAGIALIAVSSGSGSDTGTAQTDVTEEKLVEMCSRVKGVGECRVMVTYKENTSRYGASTSSGVVESVAVVCKGADKAEVRSELTAMLTALFGIRSNRIHISKMK